MQVCCWWRPEISGSVLKREIPSRPSRAYNERPCHPHDLLLLGLGSTSDKTAKLFICTRRRLWSLRCRLAEPRGCESNTRRVGYIRDCPQSTLCLQVLLGNFFLSAAMFHPSLKICGVGVALKSGYLGCHCRSVCRVVMSKQLQAMS